MGTYGDWFIMLLAGSLLLIWAYRSFYRWLHEPVSVNRIKLGKGGKIDSEDANVQLLQRSGYEVVSGKHAVPVDIEMDGAPLGQGSRLYIDYIAEKDEEMFVVKTARERLPMDWTASGVRDRLLVYSLLLPDCSGVLYVDAKDGILRKVSFRLPNE
ncbi:hypothetical protein M6D81_15645 [Paenibacillus sp. J5C_2022]|uniref:hypothetical protein n=1 Tax=Paenibacillus sp. J5C2022 TaxID=2977129 RepID=UPI0021D1772D|nr:hypothetical protein [Paenibacillus sp. J5C2022]MCU6710131.1 hypothetical protein [Paenibacillus sp. J5C2022]